jgi:multidrug efflux system membrane fusion protein
MNRIAHPNFGETVVIAHGRVDSTPERRVIPVLLAAFWLISNGCSRQSNPPEGTVPVLPRTVARSLGSDMPLALQATGQVEAMATATVRCPVDGILEKVCFQEGDEVTKGSLIFSIDPRQFQDVLDQAEAILERDQARLLSEQIQAHWQAELLQEGIIPRNDCREDCSNAEALVTAIANDEAALASAKLRRSFCDIRSPITGRTGVVSAQASVCVRKLDVLVTINQMKPIYVDFPVPAGDWPWIRACVATASTLPIRAGMPGCGQASSVGQLAGICSKADAGSDTIFLRAIFPNDDEMLLPGGRVDVVLPLPAGRNAIVVPSEPVQRGQPVERSLVVPPDAMVAAPPVLGANYMGSEMIVRWGVKNGLPGTAEKPSGKQGLYTEPAGAFDSWRNGDDGMIDGKR